MYASLLYTHDIICARHERKEEDTVVWAKENKWNVLEKEKFIVLLTWEGSISKCEKIASFVAATCAYTHAIDRSSRAGYRSILVLTSLANTRAGQSEPFLIYLF